MSATADTAGLVASTAGARPFRDASLPASVRVPRLVTLAIALSMGAGALFELTRPRPFRERLARAVFAATGMGYLTVSLVDFAEHFRLEKELTGRWLASEVVPPGETLNHAATIAVVASSLVFSRRLGHRPASKDAFVVLAPALYLALGWRDEIVYHRRRAVHREDILHTVAHLGAAATFASNAIVRLVEGCHAP